MAEELPHTLVEQHAELVGRACVLTYRIEQAGQEPGSSQRVPLLEEALSGLGSSIESLIMTAPVQAIGTSAEVAGKVIDDMDTVGDLLPLDRRDGAHHTAEQTLLFAASCAVRRGISLDALFPAQTQPDEKLSSPSALVEPTLVAPLEKSAVSETDSTYLSNGAATVLAAFLGTYRPILTAMGVEIVFDDWHGQLDHHSEDSAIDSAELADKRLEAVSDFKNLLETLRGKTITIDELDIPVGDWRRQLITDCLEQLVNEEQWDLLVDMIATPPTAIVTEARSGANRGSNITIDNITYESSWLRAARAIQRPTESPVVHTNLSAEVPSSRSTLNVEMFPQMPESLVPALKTVLELCTSENMTEDSIGATARQVLESVIGEGMVARVVWKARGKGIIPKGPQPLRLEDCIRVVLWHSGSTDYDRMLGTLNSLVLPLVTQQSKAV